MRDQLHLMELVDNYLDGTMSSTDRTAFEERLRNSEELRSLVEDQQRLRQAARRSPARTAAKKAYRNYRWGKSLPGMGAGAVVLIAATAALFLWKSPMAEGGSENAPVSESQYRTLTDTTGTHLDPLVLTIDPSRGTTLVTPNGIVLDIPQGAFVDGLGAAIATPVRVTLLEALDPLDIMKAGLSTMSGDTLLETGGMFYLDAQSNGEQVKIDPAKPLTAMVPAAEEEKRKRGSAEVPEARVRHILFSTQGKSDEDQARVKSRADSVLAVVKRDRSKFELMVEKFTEDPGSKSTGGVYEWFDKTRMVPEFTAASFDQPVGSITMCKTSYGYHIVEVLGQQSRTISASPLNAGGMMLYQGVKSQDGTIDWQNPQPLKKSLVPVDITTLNFYPPGYEAKLAELGQDVTNKTFKDSLYYSYSGGMPDTAYADSSSIYSDTDERGPRWGRFDSTYANDPYMRRLIGVTGVDPSRVKAIWQHRFNGTNLATREFEERMALIHRTCSSAALDLYVNNLDKDLSAIDEIAGTENTWREFKQFAERNDGRVDLPTHAAERLRTFYENNSRAEAEAIRKTQEKFWNEQWKQDVKSDAKRADHATAESVREGELFQKELAANLDTVYKQLGYKRVQLPRAAWVVTVNNPGWWNVDKAVIQATTTRSNMKYTDDQTGKTATLTYTPLIVEVADRASYDELVVYLIPNQLNSYQRMKEGTGGFTERLNSIFTYDLFCLGMKGKQQFAFKTNVKGQTELKAALTPVDEEALRRMVGSKSGLQQELVDEAKHLEWLVGDKQRRKSNVGRQALKAALLPVVFRCASQGAPADAVDHAPRYPGGDEARAKYIRENLEYPSETATRIVVPVMILRDGRVGEIGTQFGPPEKFVKEVERVFRNMPRWEPAIRNGRPVDEVVQIPIIFKVY
jgi:parvulin-like peptidyl-prolyl isomerase